MKKIMPWLLSILILVIGVCFIIFCSNTLEKKKEQYNTSYTRSEQNLEINFAGGKFVVIQEWQDALYHYRIIYDKETLVKYLFVNSGNGMAITPLYNEDGTIQLYEK